MFIKKAVQWFLLVLLLVSFKGLAGTPGFSLMPGGGLQVTPMTGPPITLTSLQSPAHRSVVENTLYEIKRSPDYTDHHFNSVNSLNRFIKVPGVFNEDDSIQPFIHLLRSESFTYLRFASEQLGVKKGRAIAQHVIQSGDLAPLERQLVDAQYKVGYERSLSYVAAHIAGKRLSSSVAASPTPVNLGGPTVKVYGSPQFDGRPFGEVRIPPGAKANWFRRTTKDGQEIALVYYAGQEDGVGQFCGWVVIVNGSAKVTSTPAFGQG